MYYDSNIDQDLEESISESNYSNKLMSWNIHNGSNL